MCAAMNFAHGKEVITFTSDPDGGDGILYDRDKQQSWHTEHVIITEHSGLSAKSLDDQILGAIANKQQKGDAAYAEGKVLIVFLFRTGTGERWNPGAITSRLPKLDFVEVWVIALQEAVDGAYVYGITLLDKDDGLPPIYLVRVAPNFEDWQVGQIQ
jgi:hypothetical protein